MNAYENQPTLAGEPATLPRRPAVGLLMLAAPIVAAMISRTVMSFVDFVMVSQLGTAAQAAIMPAGVLLFCFISFGMGAATAVSTFVSQSLGRDRPADCSAYGWQGLYVGLGFGLLLLPLWLLVPPFFHWVGHAPDVQAMEIDYARIGVLGIGPFVAGIALTEYFNGIHKPGVGLIAAVLSNAFNAGANYALIFGHWGMPAMGIRGAAWGTVAAAVIQLLILFGWMLRPASHRRFHAWHTWRPSGHRIRRMLAVGAPAGFQFTTDILAWTIFTLFLVGRFGTTQLAASNLVFKFMEVSFMPTVGLGVAVVAAVGRAIGQGRHDLARLSVKWGVIYGMGYMGTLAVIFLLNRHRLPALITDDPEVIAWAGKLLICVAVFQIFDAMAIMFNSALRGAGDTRWPAAVFLLYAGVLFVGGGYLVAYLRPGWGSLGPWAVATTYVVVLGVTFLARFRFGPWERIDLHRDHARA